MRRLLFLLPMMLCITTCEPKDSPNLVDPHPQFSEYPACDGDVLSTQVSIDNFDCEIVMGDLRIDGSYSLITNLDGLSELQEVRGDFEIAATKIANVGGLNSLTSVGGNFTIVNNLLLENLDGLSALTSIGGTLGIHNNDRLVQIDGLSSLTSIAEASPYEGMGLWFVGNDALMNINGLSGLSSIPGDVTFSYNSALTNVDGLSSITSISNDLNIYGNGALSNIDGLSALMSVGGDLMVQQNSELSGCVCGLYALLEGAGVGGSVTIRFNSPGCNSDDEILAQPDVYALCHLSGACSGDFTLHTQAQVDVFNCTEVTGKLLIEGTDIANLDGLSELTSVGWFLHINNNPSLTNIDGLSALTSLGGHLTISANTALTDLDGLSGLTEVPWNLSIANNAALTTLDGLSGLTVVGWHLDINGNFLLANVDGLSGLTTIGEGLLVQNNSNLANLNGLSNMTSLGGPLLIDANQSLMNIDGLSGVTSVGSWLGIHGNENLTNVDGLAALTVVKEYLSIHTNHQLSACVCGLYSLLEAGGVGETIDIKLNATGCNSAPEILAQDPRQCDWWNQPPTADPNGPYTADEGDEILFEGTDSSDPDGDPLVYSWDFGDPHNQTPGTGPTPSHTYSDNSSYTVTLTVDDGNGATDTNTTTATISNVAPSVGPITTVVVPVPVGEVIDAGATFTDPGSLDTHTATIDWGDDHVTAASVGVGSVSGDHTYAEPGVYTLTFTVADDDGGVGTGIHQFVVVYDPVAGFATGAGWIDAPGACNVAEWSACEGATGKASFGFVSKYRPGATGPEPEGQTQFRFRAGELAFESAGYDWLVVSQGGTRAQFKGWGTINGAGDYRFLIWATDGSPDTFRIKIWWEEGTVEHVLYDNLAEQAIGGGQIQVHR